MDFGTLHLPSEAPAVDPLIDWWDVPMHAWLVVICAILLLLLIPGIYRLLPAVSGCLIRSRGNIEIEHSVSRARTRSLYSRAMVIPFIIVADRFKLYDPDFIAGWDQPWLLLLELYAVLFAYLVLRIILHAVVLSVGRKHFHTEKRLAIRRGQHNYFICFVLVMMFSLCILRVFGAADDVYRNVIYAELALFWLISIVREGQILRSECGGLITFLYLCALEFLPAGAVVASATVF